MSLCIIFCAGMLAQNIIASYQIHIPRQVSQKYQTRKNLSFDKMTLQSEKFNLYQVSKWLDIHKRFQISKFSNTPKLYILKVLLSKNWFYFFFLIFRQAKLSLFFEKFGINCSLISCLSSLGFSNSICLTKKLS